MNATILIAGQRHALYQKLAAQALHIQSRKTRHTSRLLSDQPVNICFDPLTGQLTTQTDPYTAPSKDCPRPDHSTPYTAQSPMNT